MIDEADSYWDSRCRAKADSYSCCQGRLLLGLPVSTPVVGAGAAPVVIADFVDGGAPVVIVETGTVVIDKADSYWDSQCRAKADSCCCCEGRLLLGLPVSTSTVVARAAPVVIADFVDGAAPVVIVEAAPVAVVGVVVVAGVARLRLLRPALL